MSRGDGRRAWAADFPLRPTLRSPAKVLGPRASRTIARILEAAKSIFMARGFAGTTIDEIARSAGVSRASVYTYFPTKRDVLLALGADSARAGTAVVERLDDLADGWSATGIETFVEDYFRMLDEHGSFIFAWTQAAHEDDEMRTAGMKRHLRLCRRLGLITKRPGAGPVGQPTARGLVIFSMLERAWSYCRLYADAVDEADVRREIAVVLSGAER